MIKTFVIDLFAGAGGTSTAIFESKTNIEVIACINHDKNAIISHKENYPNCIHYTEDIRTVSLTNLKMLVDKLRRENPGCKIAIWASLECTHFSKAKGGLARDADSRTLAEHLFRYDDIIQPDFFWIENVREFLTWGPLDDEGQPIKEYKGCDYEKWVSEFKSRGYSYDYSILNAADFGAYTSRVRYFGQFSKNSNLISWPDTTHSKDGKDGKKKWKPVKEVLDLDNQGVSIFERKKDLAEATLNRIYSGLLKFVAGGDETFLCSYYKNSTFVGKDQPCGTLTTKDRFQKVSAVFIDNHYGNSKATSADKPLGTLTTTPKQSVVSCESHFLLNPQYSSKGGSIYKPCFTLIARMDKSPSYLVSPEKGGNFRVLGNEDSEILKKIKIFMISYGISDIKMRMLEIPEMLQIQGFPKNYKLVGTKTEQKKYIGNSVEVTVGKSLFKQIDKTINDQTRR